MSMRLQEVHPALVHFPIALLPVALAADSLGRLTGSRALMEAGRRTMPVVAASAAVAGVFGLVSQQVVELDDQTTDLLITHRNINLAAITLTAVMAVRRNRSSRPSLRYLAAGLAGMAAVSYSAYLGGHMVYEHGVGVNAAGGLQEELAPELLPETAAEVTRLAGRHIRDGAAMTVQELGERKLAPALLRPETHGP
jgi:uncharacterized membrane protein